MKSPRPAEIPEEEAAEVTRVFQGWGLTDQQIEPIVAAITSNEKQWVDFMMRFELGLSAPDSKRPVVSGVTIGLSYVVGGLIPLAPYFFAPSVQRGFTESIVLTLTALLVFGCIKAKFTGIPLLRGGLQTVLIGGLAAGAAFLLAKLFK